MRVEGNNILAIRFMRLGDVVLLLPALAQLKACYPHSHLTLLTDHRCEPLARMSPIIDEVMAVNRLDMRDGQALAALWGMGRLIKDIRRRKFDLVIDFLSFRETNLLTWLSRAKYRVAMQREERSYLSFCFNLPAVPEDKSVHVSEMFRQVVGAVGNGCGDHHPAVPTLVLPSSTQEWASQVMPPNPLVSLYVGAPVEVRKWPSKAFARVADFITKELGASVAVLAGTADTEVAGRVRALSRQPERIKVHTDLAIPELSAVIAHSRLLVSNDTGPMHIGPAFGIPTLGLFSVGFPEHYRPLGENSRFLRANPIADISVESVIGTIREMWSNCSDGLP